MKTQHAKTFFATLLLVVALLGLTTVAQVGSLVGGYDLSWHTVDGGGGASTGGTFALAGTIGQPDANTVALTGGTYSLNGGFWAGGDAIPAPTCPADISPPAGDGMVNVNDLLAVINGWGPCPVPPAPCNSDITDDGTVNVNDLLAVINAWGLCP